MRCRRIPASARCSFSLYLYDRCCDGHPCHHERNPAPGPPSLAGSRRSAGRGVKKPGGEIDPIGVLVGNAAFRLSLKVLASAEPAWISLARLTQVIVLSIAERWTGVYARW
jgi:hypothetical protein